MMDRGRNEGQGQGERESEREREIEREVDRRELRREMDEQQESSREGAPTEREERVRTMCGDSWGFGKCLAPFIAWVTYPRVDEGCSL